MSASPGSLGPGLAIRSRGFQAQQQAVQRPLELFGSVVLSGRDLATDPRNQVVTDGKPRDGRPWAFVEGFLFGCPPGTRPSDGAFQTTSAVKIHGSLSPGGGPDMREARPRCQAFYAEGYG